MQGNNDECWCFKHPDIPDGEACYPTRNEVLGEIKRFNATWPENPAEGLIQKQGDACFSNPKLQKRKWMFLNTSNKQKEEYRMKNIISIVVLVSFLLSITVVQTHAQGSSFIMFSDINFTGHQEQVDLSAYPIGRIHSLQGFNNHDKMSSIRWNLDARIRVVLYEHYNGGSRTFTIEGQGQDNDLRNDNFNDCVSGFQWFYID
jgi:hypothetical protein